MDNGALLNALDDETYERYVKHVKENNIEKQIAAKQIWRKEEQVAKFLFMIFICSFGLLLLILIGLDEKTIEPNFLAFIAFFSFMMACLAHH